MAETSAPARISWSLRCATIRSRKEGEYLLSNFDDVHAAVRSTPSDIDKVLMVRKVKHLRLRRESRKRF
jgi:hypothetical protein